MHLNPQFAIGTLVTSLHDNIILWSDRVDGDTTIERLFYGEVAIVLTKERKGWVLLISGRGKTGKTRSIDLKFII